MGKWFNHRRGLATGIAGIFIAFSFSYAPALLNWMVGNFGWRYSCVLLSGIVIFGFGTVAAIFMRDNPEQCSLVMDGITDETKLAKMSNKVPETYHQFTRKEAIRTMAFWSFTIGTSLHAFLLTAITFHLTSIAEEASRTRDQAFDIFIPMAFAGVASRFAAGYLSDRIRIKWLLIVMMAAEFAGTFGMFFFASRGGWWIAALGYGIAGGIFGTLLNVAWPRFFGRENLGGIAGLNMSILVFASAVGPWIFSMVLVETGSFRPVIAVSLLLPLLITVLACWTENPQKKFASQ
jgi:MFS family permease